MIEEEAAIEIAVPSNTKISARSANGFGGRSSVFWQEWVGDALRECAVRLVENAFELQRCSKLCQSLRDGIKRRPSSSVACIHNYFEWLKSGDINKLANFLDICRAGLFGDVADLRR